MLRLCAIVIYCFLAVNADGTFYVLNTPDSLTFQRIPAVLPSEQVGDVIKAAKGLEASDTADFSGLVINDPFGLPQKAFIVDVIGLNDIPVGDDIVSYKVEGQSVSASLEDLKLSSTENQSGCDINISNSKENLVDCVVKSKNEFVYAKIDVSNLVKNDAEKKNTISLLVNEIYSLQNKIEDETSQSLLVVIFVHENEKDATVSRKRREAVPGAKTNTYNLAAYYDQNYPVIFNIILWFMVALGLSLLAVCYAIADMDPGRDSIIYRMTSTRMKKDN